MGECRAELVRRLRLDGDEIRESESPGSFLWTPRGREVTVEIEAGERDLSARIAAVADDAAGVFGPDVSATEAAWRLLTIHLEEEYETMPAGRHRIRIVPSGIHTE